MYRHRNAAWINAYWDGQDARWAWTSGRREQPRDRNARWVDAWSTREGRAWRLYESARWSNQQVVEREDYQRWRNKNCSRRDRR